MVARSVAGKLALVVDCVWFGPMKNGVFPGVTEISVVAGLLGNRPDLTDRIPARESWARASRA